MFQLMPKMFQFCRVHFCECIQTFWAKKHVQAYEVPGEKTLVPETLYKGILGRAGWIEGKVRQSKCEPSHHMELTLYL